MRPDTTAPNFSAMQMFTFEMSAFDRSEPCGSAHRGQSQVDVALNHRPTSLVRAPSLVLALVLGLGSALGAGVGTAHAQAPANRPAVTPRMADYITAVVNQESVTAGEVRQRIARIRNEARRAGEQLPPEDELEKQVLDGLIDERTQLSLAREFGVKVEDYDVDRAVANIATQNQMSLVALRDSMNRDGMDFNRFKANVREQMMVERVREREVNSRVRITDDEIDAQVESLRGERKGEVEYNVAQILIPVPDGAGDAVVAERRAQAEAALARVTRGEDFAVVARAVSQDPNRERGGEMGLRSADRLPDLFLEAVRPLTAGAVAPGLRRSGAGFHILKLLERKDVSAATITQTRARHILLRVNDASNRDAALRQMRDLRAQIARGKPFEQVAIERSEDASAPQGGDLGWASPGQFVPEFEQAMSRLPLGGISEPVVSRFGVHLIQVLERREAALDIKQLRDQARLALREQKYSQAYDEWIKELRSRAFIERREAPQL